MRPLDVRIAPRVLERKTQVRRLLAPGVMILGICLLAVLALVITQRMTELREAPGDNLTWTLSQVEVDLLVLMDETLLAQQRNTVDPSDIRRRFNNLYSRTSTLREAPVFARMRLDPTFLSQLQTLETCLDKLALIIDSPDAVLIQQLPDVVEKLLRIREDAHAIALTGIGLRSQYSDAERASLAGLLLTAAFTSLALILFLVFVLLVIRRQYHEHKETTEEVNRANARIKSIFDVSLDAIVVANDDGVILEFNSAAEQVFGFSSEEAIGQEMSELIIPLHLRDAHKAGMERFNRTKEPHLVGKGRIEVTALRKSGEEFPVEISIGMSTDHRGTIFVSYLRDITKRLAAEDSLKTARDEALAAERAKSNFLAVMSHEMRTPLNGIFGTLELLGNSDVDDKQRGYLDIAKRSGDILLHHVNDVLDLSRIDAGKMELVEDSIDLEAFFRDAVATNEATADAQSNVLELQLGVMPQSRVMMDEQRLRQIVYNLISNALKFTKDGTVTVRAATDQTDTGERWLLFDVEDTGVGIHPDEQLHVFDRFYTQERSYDRFASGAGLGLSITKQLVEMMGGQITLKSIPSKGSVFSVSVPFEPDLAPHDSQSVRAPNLDASPLRDVEILLVEDNEINRLIVHEMLRSNGLVVHEAHNGLQAVELASQQRYAAILMDVSMPVMNGVDATHAIRRSQGPNQHTRIIGLTAHALAEEQARFLDAGMDRCLNKPVSQEMLVDALLDVVKGAAAPQAPEADGVPVDLLAEETISGLEDLLPAERLHRVVADYMREVDALIARLPALLEQDDLGEVAARVHKCIGSSGMIGAQMFKKDLRNLETAAKLGQKPQLPGLVAAVESAWPQTQAALRARVLPPRS